MYATCGHVAVGFDSHDGFRVDGQEMAAVSARPTAVAAIVVRRGGQAGIAAVRGGEGVLVCWLRGVSAIPLFKSGIRQLILCVGHHCCQCKA